MKIFENHTALRESSIYLYDLNSLIERNVYKIKYVQNNKNKKSEKEMLERVFLGYPLRPIFIKQHNNNPILYFPEDFKIYLDFLNNKVKYNGLFLKDFEDGGMYKSISISFYFDMHNKFTPEEFYNN